jgi:hypothetical protein
VKRKSSARVEAAQKVLAPAAEQAEQFVHAAADRVGPLVHNAADRVGPLAQSAADRVGPLAHSAADRVGPLAQSAADRVGPLAHQAVDRVGPLAQQAVDRVTPYAQQAVDRVTPYAQQAVDLVSPYAHQAAERVGPLAHTAKQRGARAAHDAVEILGPKLDDAFERVSPAVEAARGRVSDELLPRLSEALSAAAAAPVVVEATKRGRATVAAAKGELALPEKKKGRWVKRLAVVAALAGVAALVARKLLGSKDSDWQAARPTTPYAPAKPAAPTPPSTPTAPADEVVADAVDDPQGGESAHEAYQEANDSGIVAADDAPAEGADLPEEEEAGSAATVELGEPTEDVAPSEAGPVGSEQTYGDGAYVGDEPPEGFVIKGNENSMKYHVPDSGGYADTKAEVWFNSEEAAEAAGFVRAQG